MIRNISIVAVIVMIVASAIFFMSSDQGEQVKEEDIVSREELEAVAPSTDILPAPRDEDDISEEHAVEEPDPNDPVAK